MTTELIDKFSIKLFKGNVGEYLEFPIKPTTAPKAVLVEFEFGNAWIPIKLFSQPRFPLQRSGRGQYCLDVSLDNLSYLCAELSHNMQDERVAVKKAGKGPTAKSHKFEVDVLREKRDEFTDPNNPDYERITKTLTLGLFGVLEVDGKYFAQRSVIIKKLDKGCLLPRGRVAFTNLERLLVAAAERVTKEAELKVVEQKKQRDGRNAELSKNLSEKQATQAEQNAHRIKALLPVVSKEGDNAIVFCKKHFTLIDMQRKLKSSSFAWDKLPALPLQAEILGLKELELLEAMIKISKSKIKLPDRIIVGSTVKWVDWVGPSSKRVRQENQCEECTVRFYGAKRVIIFPDGDEITKMEGPNLQIIGGKEVEASI